MTLKKDTTRVEVGTPFTPKVSPTRDLEASPPSPGRLPAEAAGALQPDYADPSPPKSGDPLPTNSPPGPMPTFAQLKGKPR